jgi:uncharacterized protein YjbI with pentapeptide repeats
MYDDEWESLRRRSARERTMSRRRIVGIGVAVVAGLVALIVLILVGYPLNWTGFTYSVPQPGEERARALWDWLGLLIVPVALGLAALWFNWQARNRELDLQDQRDETESRMALDRQRESALQMYLDKMTELLLEWDLRQENEDAEVRGVARARTVTALRGLDKRRRNVLTHFLRELKVADLIRADLSGADLSLIDLHDFNLNGADLSGANLTWANLSKTNLTGAILSGADLNRAYLSEADLNGASLYGANLDQANLIKANLTGVNLTRADLAAAYIGEADLSGADLTNATVSHIQLAQAESLEGSTMPDGAKYGQSSWVIPTTGEKGEQ